MCKYKIYIYIGISNYIHVYVCNVDMHVTA